MRSVIGEGPGDGEGTEGRESAKIIIPARMNILFPAKSLVRLCK
jgi:hypothetical protein